MENGNEPYWRREEKQLGHRIHVMWKSHWQCNTYKNILKVQINYQKLRRSEKGGWIWSEGDEKKYFKKFQRGTMGRLGCHQKYPLSVNVSIEDNCLPIGKAPFNS